MSGKKKAGLGSQSICMNLGLELVIAHKELITILLSSPVSRACLRILSLWSSLLSHPYRLHTFSRNPPAGIQLCSIRQSRNHERFDSPWALTKEEPSIRRSIRVQTRWSRDEMKKEG
uniref:Uncharacterized protein n=1 Tax=Picea glauca TaxID=3330 RepID=A0A117NFM6_PICGL|nr:hypothetical protein ABT39_MTgene2600 [Picea glauca]QHR87071.1 hypothetical protein Q903MT_gene1080 [Picea sitchensis]